VSSKHIYFKNKFTIVFIFLNTGKEFVVVVAKAAADIELECVGTDDNPNDVKFPDPAT
jgi:hypothetical protein